MSAKKILFDNFALTREFQNEFRRCVSQYVALLGQGEIEHQPQQTQSLVANTDVIYGETYYLCAHQKHRCAALCARVPPTR